MLFEITKSKCFVIVAVSFISIACVLPTCAEVSTISPSKGISLTIYNQNFGLVRDSRKMELKNGVNYVSCQDVAAKIDPTSVSFTSLTAPNQVVVREQNYKYDLIDPNTILNKSIGKPAKFKQYTGNGQIVELNGMLLNGPSATIGNTEGGNTEVSQGLVLKTGNGIILNPLGQVELNELPAGLVSTPSLDWKIETDKAGTHDVEIAYQTADINWKCDYVAVANADDTKCDITSWVTLDNKSGGSYKDSALKLIAGDVHKVVEAPQQVMMEMATDAVAPAAPPPPQFSEQSFAEYHLYTLAGKTDVNNNETKQLSLFNAAAVPVKKLFVLESGDPQLYPAYGGGDGDKRKIQIKLEMMNSDDNHLGMPMPKGKVRVYKKDSDGALQFVGEDQIDHTPRDEKVRIYLGDAFDVVGERRQTNMEQPNNRTQRMSYEIVLRNHKKENVRVQVIEHAYGDWKITNSSQPHTKKDSHTFEFPVDVPANGEVTVTYTIEVKS